jgi:UDP-glucose 4-epimerase
LKKVLVLGANGFIGQHIVQQLLVNGDDVRVYERRPAVALPPGVDIRHGLLEDRAALLSALEDRDCVIYLSWTGYPATFDARFALDIHSNLFTAIGVMDACREMRISRLIFASSGGTVYGVPRTIPIVETHPTEPISEHGLGKLIGERYLAVYRHRGEVSSLILRPANAYGPGQRPDRGQGFVATVMGRLAQGRPLEIWGDGSVVRDYVYVVDVAKAFVAAVHYTGDETIFNVGSGIGKSLNEVVDAISRITGKLPQVRNQSARRADVPANILDTRRSATELSWRAACSFEEGLAATWNWIQTSWVTKA